MFNLFRIRPAGVLSCLLVGLFSQALYNMFYMRTIKESGMAVAAVLLYTSPVFVALMSRIFFRESLGKNKVTAIMINIIGCILTVTGGGLETLSFAGSGHGALAGVLADQGVSVLICGGIGGGAQEALTASGIELCAGASVSADEAVEAYLRGELANTGANCDHHGEGHGEGGHNCGNGGCGHDCHSEPLIQGKNAGKKVKTHYRGTFNDGTQMVAGAEDLEVGQQLYLQAAEGRPIPAKVIAKDEHTITFDTNHEMAGKELNFLIELLEVQDN